MIDAEHGAVPPSIPSNSTLRDLLEQLDTPTDVVDASSDEVAAAPADQTERIRLFSPTATFGDLTLGVGADIARSLELAGTRSAGPGGSVLVAPTFAAPRDTLRPSACGRPG
ncbi:hypothetical protein [Nocardiopsis sp. L17-MgMaSL7]|uniref:hypothetical protein n=1 Tax=Nocardiopsis sp. L17-MgMaSL7 TaxID=1938893 RepID=UPI0011B56F44|nr:hypothetical protein [Nocardiopsis sp. L17-MgMaSL7]